MDGTIYVILKVLFDFALEVWFSIIVLVMFFHTVTLNILTPTKNASLIITDFLAMVYRNEQLRTASLCRGWTMLVNDFNLICRYRVIQMTSYRLNIHMTALCINRL